MNILDEIIEQKKLEVAERRMSAPIQELQSSEFFYRPSLSLKQSLQRPGSTGIIAEFKRRSPSKGNINVLANVADLTTAYSEGGAAGLSVLTDTSFFGGANADLTAARSNVIPILRKDFIIDEYQIVEAKSIGADVVLLIAACLRPGDVARLAAFAKSIGLEVLLEIHNEKELDHICADCDLIGVNNRDLKTFTVDAQRSIDLASKIPADKIKISESGINDPATISILRGHGFLGFLIGERFMKDNDPAAAFASFVQQLEPINRV